MAEENINAVLALAAFDRDELLEAMDGDKAFCDEIIEVFRKESSELIAALDAAIISGDAEGIEKTAHSLKGSALTISAEKIARLAHILESMGRDGDLSGVGQVFLHLKAGHEELEKIFNSRYWRNTG